MLKDIPQNVVKDVALAVVKEQNDQDETVWNVYLVNMKEEMLEGVLVSSKGYGYYNGESVKTSTLRHFLDVVDAQSYCKVEPIMTTLFGLNNEYWLSFYQNSKIFDRKYIFLPDAISENNFTNIPIINKRGVMIK